MENNDLGDRITKRVVRRLVFFAGLVYSRKEGARTPQVSEKLRFFWCFGQSGKMADTGGEISNLSDTLFETLAEWEEQLKHIDNNELSDGLEVGP